MIQGWFVQQQYTAGGVDEKKTTPKQNVAIDCRSVHVDMEIMRSDAFDDHLFKNVVCMYNGRKYLLNTYTFHLTMYCVNTLHVTLTGQIFLHHIIKLYAT